jgi:hypothetical protein
MQAIWVGAQRTPRLGTWIRVGLEAACNIGGAGFHPTCVRVANQRESHPCNWRPSCRSRLLYALGGIWPAKTASEAPEVSPRRLFWSIDASSRARYLATNGGCRRLAM